MTVWTIIHVVDVLLWLIMAANVFYVLLFAVASHLPLRHKSPTSHSSPPTFHSFLVLFPAYHEDTVIKNSVATFLKQDYPTDLYQVVVISDHMLPETNQWLAQQPVTLLQPTFEKSSKAKALQYAIHNSRFTMPDFVIVLDADNVVGPAFLSKLSMVVRSDEAIQCHRTAKNADNDIAALDGISEEINNSIFRRGHNRIGMSSALIGSGMCFSYQWFKDNVEKLDSAVEDRELEALLMKQGIFVRYAEDIYVKDEKVSSSDNFQRQRLRWMTGQVQALCRMLPYIPKAVLTGNINYIDKTIQQALVPRSILLLIVPLLTILSLLTSHYSLLIPYLFLLVCLYLAIFLAIPSQLRTKAIFSKVITLPLLVWKMLKNILHIHPQNKEFIHTTHNQ